MFDATIVALHVLIKIAYLFINVAKLDAILSHGENLNYKEVFSLDLH